MPSASRTQASKDALHTGVARSGASATLLLCGAVLAGACLLAGCGGGGRHESIPRALREEARPIGAGARFHPTLENRPVPGCDRALGRRLEAHVELFAKNRVVLLPAGIGTRPPRKLEDGRVAEARCYGPVVTLEPTGVVLSRTDAGATVAGLFAAWGQPLSETRIASFAAPAGTRVSAYVDGRRWRGRPGAIVLSQHAEVVLEVGPHVPPHRSFAFPPMP